MFASARKNKVDGSAPPGVDFEGVRQGVRGAYLGLAVGDALGASVEFMTPREIRVNHGVLADIIGGGWLRLKPGQVTDDTGMALALGDSILEEGMIESRSVAEHFSRWMSSRPVDIGHTVRRGIMHYRRTGESRMPPEEYSAGNGACMRCLPVAIATLGQEPDAVREAVLTQSRVTHNNPLSDAGTVLVVDLIQQALSGLERVALESSVASFASQNPRFHFDGKRTENPGGYIVETLQAVVQAFLDHHDFRGCMIDVVNRGGDADTTGAILGMIAGAYYGESSIPRPWRKRLNPQVQQRCLGQAEALLELAMQNPGFTEMRGRAGGR